MSEYSTKYLKFYADFEIKSNVKEDLTAIAHFSNKFRIESTIYRLRSLKISYPNHLK